MRHYILGAFLLFGILVFGCVGSNSPRQNETIEINGTITRCIDGDLGINENVSSFVALGRETSNDSCLDNQTVFENYCNDQNQSASRQVNCGVNRICQNGACVAKPIETNTAPTRQPNCLETDDGNRVYTSGSVTIRNTTYTDTCQGLYSIMEYYCNTDESLGQNTTNCPNGAQCQRGACVDLERQCSDSDTNDQTKSGHVTLYGGGVVLQTSQDICIDNNQHIEYYCDGTSVGQRIVQCQNNEYCDGGLCLAKCQEFDRNLSDSYSKSYVRTQNNTYFDQCRDSKTLTSWRCNGNNAISQNINCDGTCVDARCISTEDLECNNRASGAEILYRGKVIDSKNNTCIDTHTIRYYSCDQGEIFNAPTRCAVGETCYAGNCIEQAANTCYDLDAGQNDTTTKSYVVTVDRNEERREEQDTCFNFQTVIEYRCDGTQSKPEYINCPQGKSCRDGACR